jgi:hypothetical protein
MLMLYPETIPVEKRTLLAQLVSDLRRVPGVLAIVLGGSYARGTQRPGSDLDIGIYYSDADPFAIDDLQRIASGVSVEGEPVVTDFYEWGLWVNGGAWIYTAAGKVDFLYRNLDQVQRTIEEAHQGIVRHDYGQQPAYGFYSVIYLAETQVCLPLYDPQGHIAALKEQVAVYPPGLQKRIVADNLWSAEFTLLHAHDFASAGDVYNTVGCLTRAAANLTQAIFALNATYFMGDKNVMQILAAFPHAPARYSERVNRLLAAPGQDAAGLSHTVYDLAKLWQEVVAFTAGKYSPKFTLKK